MPNIYDPDYKGKNRRFKVPLPYHYFYLGQVFLPSGEPTKLFKIGIAECCECRMKNLSSYAFLYNKGYVKLIRKWKFNNELEARKVENIAIHLIFRLGYISPVGREWADSTIINMKTLAISAVGDFKKGCTVVKGKFHNAVV